ncbi:Endonuclease III, partial [uncultured Rubrobacteraceae bacterium]
EPISSPRPGSRSPLEGRVPGRAHGAGMDEPPGASGSHDPLRPDHRRAGQPGDGEPLREVPHSRRLRRLDPGGARGGYPSHGFLPQQGPVLAEHGRRPRGGARRRSPAHHARSRSAARRRPQDGQRRPGQRLRRGRGRRRRHPRPPRLRQAGVDGGSGPGEDRARPHEARAERRLDHLLTPPDPPRPPNLQGSQTRLPQLHPQRHLPLSRPL